MLAICPHLIPDYFEKVKDIVTVYHSQIVEQVIYTSVSDGLVSRRVYSQEQHENLISTTTVNIDQMTKALEMIQQRLWGLEKFVMVLMDQNINPWLAEELFQTYSKYLVEHMKTQKSLRKCDCPVGLEYTFHGVLSDRWIDLWKTMDSWMNKLGTSLGCLNQNLFQPNLSFFNNKLPFSRRKSAPVIDSTMSHFRSSCSESPSIVITEITEEPTKCISESSTTKDIANMSNQTNFSSDSKYPVRDMINEIAVLTTNELEHKNSGINTKDAGSQYDVQEEDYDEPDLSWIEDEIEDEIAALDISRISFMSLDLDWDLENDDELELDEAKQDLQTSPERLNTFTQTDALSNDIRSVEKVAKRKSIPTVSPLNSLKSTPRKAMISPSPKSKT